MEKTHKTRTRDIVKALMRVSNISKGAIIHLLFFIYTGLSAFSDLRLSNSRPIILITAILVCWYWLVRLCAKQAKEKGVTRPKILIVENVAEVFVIGVLLWFFGRSNGPLFFFYGFVLMESCLLFSAKLPWVIMGIGSSITIIEFLYLLQLGEIALVADNLIFLFARLCFFGFLAWYFSVLAKVNIFERRKTEELSTATVDLKKAHKELQRTDRLKSEFLGMSSHQLRTPLTVIKGYLSMIMEGDYGKVPPKISAVLENVLKANQRLVKTVGDLLDISRIDLGEMKLEKTAVQIEDLLESCHEEMQFKAKEKGIKMIYKKPSSPLPKIHVDELKIRHVILNLIDNAVRYTKKGHIAISAEKKKNHILIKVKDTGVGLGEDEQADIFEGFTRGSAGIDFFTEGAGLGLYVSRKYVRLHKGKTWAESPGKDKGSTFFIELPIT